MQDSSKTLYIVATPIGNLSDISKRAIEVLSEVDLILAEDTRHSKRLLEHIGSNVRLIALHDHNEKEKAEQLLKEMEPAKSYALISDAGTPLISDPGYHLVNLAYSYGVKVSPVPGACAAIAALSCSGIATNSFYFHGFLPATNSSREKELSLLQDNTSTLIFYEAPHRILNSIHSMFSVLGNRQVSIAREITKQYEQIVSCSLEEALDKLNNEVIPIKGEFVVIVSGNVETKSIEEAELEKILTALLEELPVKKAASVASKITGINKNQLYTKALELKQ